MLVLLLVSLLAVFFGALNPTLCGVQSVHWLCNPCTGALYNPFRGPNLRLVAFFVSMIQRGPKIVKGSQLSPLARCA